MPSDSWKSNAGRGRARAPASEEAWQEMVVLLQWRVGVPHGAGMYLWTDGWMYEGEWWHGLGQVLLAVGPGVTLEGEFKDGFMDGDDTYTAAAGDRYKGSWSMNLKHGNGRKSYVNGVQ
ncbi:hypothetical protein VPH35_090378 [Triticum aestivum]